MGINKRTLVEDVIPIPENIQYILEEKSKNGNSQWTEDDFYKLKEEEFLTLAAIRRFQRIIQPPPAAYEYEDIRKSTLADLYNDMVLFHVHSCRKKHEYTNDSVFLCKERNGNTACGHFEEVDPYDFHSLELKVRISIKVLISLSATEEKRLSLLLDKLSWRQFLSGKIDQDAAFHASVKKSYQARYAFSEIQIEEFLPSKGEEQRKRPKIFALQEFKKLIGTCETENGELLMSEVINPIKKAYEKFLKC